MVTRLDNAKIEVEISTERALAALGSLEEDITKRLSQIKPAVESDAIRRLRDTDDKRRRDDDRRGETNAETDRQARNLFERLERFRFSQLRGKIPDVFERGVEGAAALVAAPIAAIPGVGPGLAESARPAIRMGLRLTEIMGPVAADVVKDSLPSAVPSAIKDSVAGAITGASDKLTQAFAVNEAIQPTIETFQKLVQGQLALGATPSAMGSESGAADLIRKIYDWNYMQARLQRNIQKETLRTQGKTLMDFFKEKAF